LRCTIDREQKLPGKLTGREKETSRKLLLSNEDRQGSGVGDARCGKFSKETTSSLEEKHGFPRTRKEKKEYPKADCSLFPAADDDRRRRFADKGIIQERKTTGNGVAARERFEEDRNVGPA